jgi:tRNA1Val (adenine37-N6)-methyltransferase
MSLFRLKYFSIQQASSAMKVGTDAMVLGALLDTAHCRSILDVGSGTGILALIAAQKNPHARIVGLEVDTQAVEECTLNFQASPWSDRLECACADFLHWNPNAHFDLIVSNPPYYQTNHTNPDDRLTLARHVGELTAERFFSRVDALTTPDGVCEIIVPAPDESHWLAAAAAVAFYLVRRTVVFGKRGGEAKRVVLRFQRTKTVRVESTLTLRESDGKYTAEYVELTRELHGVPL